MIRTLVPEFDTFWASNSVNSVENVVALADIGLPGATYLIITNAGLSIKLVKLHSPADVSTVWSSDASTTFNIYALRNSCFGWLCCSWRLSWLATLVVPFNVGVLLAAS